MQVAFSIDLLRFRGFWFKFSAELPLARWILCFLLTERLMGVADPCSVNAVGKC